MNSVSLIPFSENTTPAKLLTEKFLSTFHISTELDRLRNENAHKLAFISEHEKNIDPYTYQHLCYGLLSKLDHLSNMDLHLIGYTSYNKILDEFIFEENHVSSLSLKNSTISVPTNTPVLNSQSDISLLHCNNNTSNSSAIVQSPCKETESGNEPAIFVPGAMQDTIIEKMKHPSHSEKSSPIFTITNSSKNLTREVRTTQSLPDYIPLEEGEIHENDGTLRTQKSQSATKKRKSGVQDSDDNNPHKKRRTDEKKETYSYDTPCAHLFDIPFHTRSCNNLNPFERVSLQDRKYGLNIAKYKDSGYIYVGCPLSYCKYLHYANLDKYDSELNYKLWLPSDEAEAAQLVQTRGFKVISHRR